MSVIFELTWFIFNFTWTQYVMIHTIFQGITFFPSGSLVRMTHLIIYQGTLQINTDHYVAFRQKDNKLASASPWRPRECQQPLLLLLTAGCLCHAGDEQKAVILRFPLKNILFLMFVLKHMVNKWKCLLCTATYLQISGEEQPHEGSWVPPPGHFEHRPPTAMLWKIAEGNTGTYSMRHKWSTAHTLKQTNPLRCDSAVHLYLLVKSTFTFRVCQIPDLWRHTHLLPSILTAKTTETY